MAKSLLTGDALKLRAEELGVNIASGEMINVAGQGMASIPAHEHEIQRRVLEAERHGRESRLWIVALVSAIASVISAAAAWVAIFHGSDHAVAAPSVPMSTQPGASAKPMAKEIYERRERCAKDAGEWFKRNYSEPQDPVPVKGGGSISSLPPTYENHYSQAHSGCFAVLSQMMSFKYGSQPNPKDNVLQSNTLWDVNENSQLGAYVVKDLHEVTACNVLGTKCTSKEQWMDLAKTYIAE